MSIQESEISANDPVTVSRNLDRIARLQVTDPCRFVLVMHSFVAGIPGTVRQASFRRSAHESCNRHRLASGGVGLFAPIFPAQGWVW